MLFNIKYLRNSKNNYVTDICREGFNELKVYKSFKVEKIRQN